MKNKTNWIPKLGEKVKIPKTKTIGTSLSSSCVINRAKKLGQDFLYYRGKNRDCYHCLNEVNKGVGDLFALEDLEPYRDKYTIEELRVADIQILVDNLDQAQQLARAVKCTYDWDIKPGSYPIYVKLNTYHCPDWYYLSLTNKTINFNQVIMENKKIIGYKLIKPEYRNAVAGITNQINFLSKIYDTLELDLMFNSCSIKKLNEAKVLDIWFEPIYEKEEVIINLQHSQGIFQIHVKDGKAYYKAENKKLPKQYIKDIINSFEHKIIANISHPYSITTHTTVDVGCMKDTKKQDWENVYKLLL